MSPTVAVRLDPATWTPKPQSAGAVRITEISVVEKIGTVDDLLQEHWQELATDKALMVLKPDMQRYEALESAGLVLALGAFDGERMVGYSVSFVAQHLHYADLRFLQNDVLFVARSHRKGMTGLKLIRETERLGRSRGAQLVIWHAKPDTALDRLLPRLGYRVQDVLYSKEL